MEGAGEDGQETPASCIGRPCQRRETVQSRLPGAGGELKCGSAAYVARAPTCLSRTKTRQLIRLYLLPDARSLGAVARLRCGDIASERQNAAGTDMPKTPVTQSLRTHGREGARPCGGHHDVSPSRVS